MRRMLKLAEFLAESKDKTITAPLLTFRTKPRRTVTAPELVLEVPRVPTVTAPELVLQVPKTKSVPAQRGDDGSSESSGKDADLQAEDLTNRLDDAVEAINDCVAILKELGMDSGRAESEILSIVKDEISPEAVPGGLAAGRPDSDFDPAQIEKGIKIELEHTGDAEVAREIAKDHLCENSKYYDHLEEMEQKMEGKGKEGGKKQDASDATAKATQHFSEIMNLVRRAVNLINKTLRLNEGNADFDPLRMEEIGNQLVDAEIKLHDLWDKLEPPR